MKSLAVCIIALVACGILASGCKTGAQKPPAPVTSQPAIATSGPMQMMVTAHSDRRDDPRDPQPQLRAMVHLDIYLLDLPPGSVSDNNEFWKRVDEEAMGIGNRDLLEKNGLRAGVAPRSEGAFFTRFFDQLPHHSRRSTMDGLHAETIQLQMETTFDSQDLFVYHKAEQQPEGRSYENGTNNLMLAFGPTPRDPSAVRITLCPTVHSQRRRMQFNLLNQEHETTANENDRIYDLNLTADVPQDSFLVITPGADSARRTSVGGCFLIKPDATGRREQAIVIVPTFLRLDGKPMILRAPLVK